MSQRNAPLAVVILAAGQGTRMKSDRAKVLHELCGLPLISHVLRAADPIPPTLTVVVVGRDADGVRALCGTGAACVA